MPERFTSFEEFWPYYVGEHRSPDCRMLHYIGTTGVFVFALAALMISPWFLLGMPLFAYGFAWAGHFLVEKNRPATFDYPLWSLRGDFRMYRLFVTGRMHTEMFRLYGGWAPAADAPLVED